MEKEKKESLEKVVRPVIKWLNENQHPHTKIIIYSNNFKLLEGIIGMTINDYIKD